MTSRPRGLRDGCGSQFITSQTSSSGMRLLLLSFFLSASTFAQPIQTRYSEVRLHITGRAELADLAHVGVAIDHPIVTETATGYDVDVVLNAWEVERLQSSSIAYDVLVEDLAASFAERPGVTPDRRAELERVGGLEHFTYGTMAGFLRFEELVTELDSMRMLFPHLASARISLGQTHEGRDIWMVKISDNPDLEEGEPEALYTAIHHAREPQSMMTVVYFMWYLLENYGVDSQVTSLVDTRELYFVPMINPDGYVYNETTDPDGGGLWRKNRRDNQDGSFGVDPNRNYGYLWGLDDIGSSPNPSSGTYRGPAPFSEPENQAIRDFLESRSFGTAANFHSRGEEYLYPWTHATATYTPDDALFNTTSADMAFENGYEYGTAADVLYPVNGSSDDWMYGEQTTKPKILAWTPEVCNRTTDGFWPPLERIIPIAQENIRANLILAELAGSAPVAEEPGVAEPPSLLSSAFPNPFEGSTSIRLSLAEATRVSFDVVDVLGRTVYTESSLSRLAGLHAFTWNGRDSNGQDAAPGLYILRFQTNDGRTQSRRVIKVD